MKSLLIIIFVAMALGFAPGTRGAAFTNAPGTKFASNELQELSVAATASLDRLRRHIKASNFQLMGFSNATEIANATNGEPMLVFTVPFSRLTNYKSGDDFSSLLQPPAGTRLIPDVIIPVMVGTNIRSSSTLRIERAASGGPERWVEGDWGHRQVIRNLIATSRAIPVGDLHEDTVPFAVRLPIPRIWLIGYLNKPKELILRATADIRLGAVIIDRNEVVPKAVMQRWAAEARRHDPGFPH